MNPTNITVKLGEVSHEYEIKIGNDLLNTGGEWARVCLPDSTNKIALVSNPKVFRLYGDEVKKSLENADFEVFVWLMKDGERFKNLRTLEQLLSFLSQNKFTRIDSVAALGGGVVGDLAGFASAVYLRGIPFLQIPTTLLAMIDSSVGGKTGVNTNFGKNLIGAFYQPNGVLIDVATLKTLPKRELTAGFCEAVKQGVVASRTLFDQTAGFLRNYKVGRFKKYFKDKKFHSELKKLLAAQVAFKAEIVMRDEREDAGRTDAKSRKILNFGHTLAHALEKVTDYKYFKHGEAVGFGMIFAAELSKKLEICDENELKSLNDVVMLAGNLPAASNINLEKVFRAFDFDKKTIGKSRHWILLEKIGKPKIVSDEQIPKSAIHDSLIKVMREINGL